jgi:hypothetical protein
VPDGYHLFFSDGFKLTTGTATTAVDMRGWDGVAFLLADATSTATVQMADDAAFTVGLVTPVLEIDRATPIQMASGAALPYWLEAWRPNKRYLRCSGATGAVQIFQFRHTGTMPLSPAPNRAGGRVT